MRHGRVDRARTATPWRRNPRRASGAASWRPTKAHAARAQHELAARFGRGGVAQPRARRTDSAAAAARYHRKGLGVAQDAAESERRRQLAADQGPRRARAARARRALWARRRAAWLPVGLAHGAPHPLPAVHPRVRPNTQRPLFDTQRPLFETLRLAAQHPAPLAHGE